MPAIWSIDSIEMTEGSYSSTIAWRCTYGDATAYGAVSVEGLAITPTTTEEEVVARVKNALNATVEQRDESGNAIPPKPGEETARTDAIEASLAKQAEELAHPKNRTIPLPWNK